MTTELRGRPIALIEFLNDLDHFSDILDLGEAFKAFAGSVSPESIHGQEYIWQEANQLKNLAPSVRVALPKVSGSTLLYLCGSFERFVRDLIADVIDDYISRVTGYKELSRDLVRAVLKNTVKIAQKPERYQYSDHELARLIKSLSDLLLETPDVPVEINSEILTITDANMNPDVIVALFKQIEIKDLWRKIADKPLVYQLFYDKPHPDCHQRARSRLEEIMRQRNLIAHPNMSTAYPSSQQVLESIEYFRALADALSEISATSPLCARP